MGQKNGKALSQNSQGRSESFPSEDEFSDIEDAPVARQKKALFNPYFRNLIGECYSTAHVDLPQRILNRCAQQRGDVKEFFDALGYEGKAALREELQAFIEDAIAHLDDEDAVKRISREYGRAQVPLRRLGHKPDFFAAIADSIATECVFIGSQATAASPTNTFKAWTVLVGVMFSAVRDGYYDELRRTRKQSPGLEGRTLESMKTSSVDSTSSSCGDRASPSVSSRGSPHSTRGSSSGGPRDSPRGPSIVSRVTSPLPPSGAATSSKRHAYRGSKSAAVMLSQDVTLCSRSCDAICGEQGNVQQPQSSNGSNGTLAAAVKAAIPVVPSVPAKSESSSSNGASPAHRDYRLPPQHRSADLLRSESPRSPASVTGRFMKNFSLDYESKRKQRLEDIGRKHNTAYLSRKQSNSSSCVFDPNRIIDRFMNDEPF